MTLILDQEKDSRTAVPNLFGPGTGFTEDNFSMDQGGGGMVLGGFKHITFIVHFISIIITGWAKKCLGASSSCGEQRLHFFAVHRLLIAVASLVAEDEL